MSWTRIQQFAEVRRIVAPKIARRPNCEVSESAEHLTLKRKDRKSQHIVYKVDKCSGDQRDRSIKDAFWEPLIQPQARK